MFFLSNSFIVNDETLITLQVDGIASGFTVNPEKLISYQGTPWFSFNGKNYAPFSYLLPILAYPLYILLLLFNTYFYPDILLFLIPSAVLLYLAKNRRILLLAAAFILANIILFRPIYLFEDWAALYSLKLVNVIAISITASILHTLLKEDFGENTAIAGILIFLFATPIAYWAVTAKSHALSLMLISAAIYYLRVRENICLASFLAALAVWARPLDGLAITVSIILLLRDKRILHAIPGFVAGYLPCALFGYLLFGLPMPVEVIGNMFSNVSYVKPIFDPSILPFVFFGINNRTLGLISYSPILAILVPSIYISIRFRKIVGTVKMTVFERFLLIFALITFLIYLPFLQSGVVETGVRDYRFYLPLYIPLTYFICKRLWERRIKIKPENFILTITTFSLLTVILFSLFNTFAGYAEYAYLCISAILIMLFALFNRFKNETASEILPLSAIPVIFLISDQLLGYFSPYNIHFCLPLLDRFVEFLIWLKNFTVAV